MPYYLRNITNVERWISKKYKAENRRVVNCYFNR